MDSAGVGRSAVAAWGSLPSMTRQIARVRTSPPHVPFPEVTMPRWRHVVLVACVAAWSAGCDRGATAPSGVTLGQWRTLPPAAEADMAGSWKVTRLWPEYPIFGEYAWAFENTPLSISIRPDALVFESPCRVCTAARHPLSGGMLLETPACEPRECHGDESEGAGADLVVSCLQGSVSATYEAQTFPQRTQSLGLSTSGGELLLER